MPEIVQIQFAERAFESADLDALEQIEKEAGDACWSRSQIKLSSDDLEMDTRLITAPEAFGQPIGFYVVEHGDDVLYLCNIAVAVDWRRCGAGLFALDAAARLGRELSYKKLALHVQEENLPAQLLYRKAGFRVVDIKREHYGTQDGFYMEQEL
ncbi:MAG: GNAT family N-acetyltransferase [Verrucomicrobiales bacterium]|nr:GNAT family N-acetyltransferase [Verrucomicrobiales bacterium]